MDASFADQGCVSVEASAKPTAFAVVYTDRADPQLAYPEALANQLVGYDSDPSLPEIVIVSSPRRFMNSDTGCRRLK